MPATPDPGDVPIAVATSVPSAQSPQPPAPKKREEKTVKVGDRVETLRLAWASVRLATIPDTDQMVRVPGRFGAFGEWGELFVLRQRTGLPDDRLDLGVIALPRWPHLADDGDSAAAGVVTKRTELSALTLQDYDHDGIMGEFPLVVEVHSPGTFAEDYRSILVGVDRRRDRLVAMHDVRWPDHPITLTDWGPLARGNPAEIVQSPCGDHGRSYEKTYVVRADRDGLHVTTREYDCVSAKGSEPKRGRRLSERPWEPDDHGVHGNYPNYFRPSKGEE